MKEMVVAIPQPARYARIAEQAYKGERYILIDLNSQLGIAIVRREPNVAELRQLGRISYSVNDETPGEWWLVASSWDAPGDAADAVLHLKHIHDLFKKWVIQNANESGNPYRLVSVWTEMYMKVSPNYTQVTVGLQGGREPWDMATEQAGQIDQAAVDSFQRRLGEVRDDLIAELNKMKFGIWTSNDEIN